MALLTIPSSRVVYTMSPGHAPAARCASGDTLCFQTLDCFGGQITSPDQRLGGLDWDHINPATGPLYVEGARPGDGLKGSSAPPSPRRPPGSSPSARAGPSSMRSSPFPSVP